MSLRQGPEGVCVVDLADEPKFSADIQDVIDRLAAYGPTDLVFNMSSVTLLTSSQLAALLHIRHRLREGRKRIILYAVPSRLRDVLRMSGLDKAFDCADDLSVAVASLRAAA